MTIAINCRFNKADQPEGYSDLLLAILQQVTGKFPQHQFLFIADKPFAENITFPKNVALIVTGPQTTTVLRLQYWFNYKIPALLRKHKADVFVSMEGICSLRTKIPQCLVFTDLGFLQKPQLLKRSQARYLKKNTAAFLAKAKSIAAVSEFGQDVIADQYKINAADITLINPGIDEIFKPLEWDEKELIKEKYTEGKAYFLFSGNFNQRSNLINLLKAFSFFKKRQKSNMMLLIAGNADDTFKKELSTYKLRNEVLLLENLPAEDLAKITASAYALIYPVLYADFALPVLQAMQCHVPVVSSNAGALPSICGNAAIYCDPNDFKDIAENMMLVFKDEDRANELVQAGKALLPNYQWGKAADLLMQCIIKCAS